MELVAETERLLTLYDTVPTTNEIIPTSTWVHWDHHVVQLVLLYTSNYDRNFKCINLR